MANREDILFERTDCIRDMDYDAYGFALTEISNVVRDLDGEEIILGTYLYFQVKDPNKNISNSFSPNSRCVIEMKHISAAENYFKNVSIVEAIKIALSIEPEQSLHIFKQIPTGIFEDKAVIREILDMIPIHEHSETAPYIEVIKYKRHLIEMSKKSSEEIAENKRIEIVKAYDKAFKR